MKQSVVFGRANNPNSQAPDEHGKASTRSQDARIASCDAAGDRSKPDA